MRYYFGNNLINKISCYLYNKCENHTQKIWLKKKHIAICCVCRNEISSDKNNKNYWEFSPEQCGWKIIKGSKKTDWCHYVCHRCLCHHDENFISLKDIGEIDYIDDSFIFNGYIGRIKKAISSCFPENERKKLIIYVNQKEE